MCGRHYFTRRCGEINQPSRKVVLNVSFRPKQLQNTEQSTNIKGKCVHQQVSSECQKKQLRVKSRRIEWVKNKERKERKLEECSQRFIKSRTVLKMVGERKKGMKLQGIDLWIELWTDRIELWTAPVKLNWTLNTLTLNFEVVTSLDHSKDHGQKQEDSWQARKHSKVSFESNVLYWFNQKNHLFRGD